MKASDIPSSEAPDWLPDWKDASAYPEHDSKRLWAWEFLRRNPEYQNDYLRYSSLPSFHPNGGKTGKFSGKPLGDDLVFYHCDPPALPGETYEEYRKRHRHKEWDMKPLEAYLMDRWGVCDIWNPAAEEAYFGGHGEYLECKPPHLFEFESESEYCDVDPISKKRKGSRLTRLLSWSDISDTDAENHVFFRFDIRYSFEDQWGDVLEKLKEYKDVMVGYGNFEAKQPKHPHLRKLPEYLRVYDATWKGIKQQEIAEFLFPGIPCDDPKGKARKQVKRSLDEARRLILGGYRNLILWA